MTMEIIIDTHKPGLPSIQQECWEGGELGSELTIEGTPEQIRAFGQMILEKVKA